ncbi:hypothetical protein ARMGADRAFT_158353 [Armillaria gallica]|uniref:Uncharacterized protein n=1 Tax=Armillaria gallica TaxID=47427 RepID=A0A2H3CVG1_ARMGA|nr:hypothetical protein ARMGADRAFT_158353 [Armillaria gallica]
MLCWSGIQANAPYLASRYTHQVGEDNLSLHLTWTGTLASRVSDLVDFWPLLVEIYDTSKASRSSLPTVAELYPLERVLAPSRSLQMLGWRYTGVWTRYLSYHALYGFAVKRGTYSISSCFLTPSGQRSNVCFSTSKPTRRRRGQCPGCLNRRICKSDV